MGMEGEAGGESMHHIWKRVIESQGEVKDKNSPAYTKVTLNSLLKLNADNV